MTRKWNGYWINTGKTMGAPSPTVGAAPYLRKTFQCEKAPSEAKIYLCGLGWHQLFVNGVRVDNRELAPVVTQYDHHDSYIEYDVSRLLKPGRNAAVVLLGNGWYNCHTTETWSFDKAPWRDWPKLLCDIVADGALLAKSDTSWLVHDSPITFDALRNGEHYDARLEIPGFSDPDFDDSDWERPAPAPWDGIPEIAEWNYDIREEDPERIVKLEEGSFLIDFGREAIAQIEMTAPAPAYVELRLGEELQNSRCVLFQLRAEICYQELWHFARPGQILSHFGVRAFRYAEVHGFPGELTRDNFRRRVIHAPFQADAVHFVSDNPELNRIWELCRYTVEATAMDLYTDCFTRERICYEADTFVNMLANFAVDSAAPAARRSVGYMINHPTWPCEWMQMMIPVTYEYYMHTADAETVRKHWKDLIQKASYIHLLENGLVRHFPLEIIVDWPMELCDGCEINADYVAIPHFLLYGNLRKLAFLAKEIGEEDIFTSVADNILPAIRSAFRDPERRLFVDHRGSSHVSLHTNVWALWNQVAQPEDRETILDFIVSKGMACGIYNALYVLDVLFENGRTEEALALILNDGPHSWRNMLKLGATITTEAWHYKQKTNMSWAHPWGASPAHAIIRHLCGLRPELPGWRKYSLNPKSVNGLQFSFDYTLPDGRKIHYSTNQAKAVNE